MCCLWADLRSLWSSWTCRPSSRYRAQLWRFPSERGLVDADAHGPASPRVLTPNHPLETEHVLDAFVPEDGDAPSFPPTAPSLHVHRAEVRVDTLKSGMNCFSLALLCWEQGHFPLHSMLLSCGRPTMRWLIRSSDETKDRDLLSHLHLLVHVELPSRRRKKAVDPVVAGGRSEGQRWTTLKPHVGPLEDFHLQHLQLKKTTLTRSKR